MSCHDVINQKNELHPGSPRSVLLPFDSLMGQSTHSDSSASFDVRYPKQVLGNLALHRCDSFAESFTTTASSPVEQRVSFSSEVETYHIVHCNEMDEDEKTVRWYRSTELKRLRKESRTTARLIRDGLLFRDTDDHCLLGLDGEAHAYAHQREIHKLMVQELVLAEQERQRERGECDPEGLSDMVAELRSRCRHAKFMSGLRDDRTERRGILN